MAETCTHPLDCMQNHGTGSGVGAIGKHCTNLQRAGVQGECQGSHAFCNLCHDLVHGAWNGNGTSLQLVKFGVVNSYRLELDTCMVPMCLRPEGIQALIYMVSYVSAIQGLTIFGAMKAIALWMAPPAMAGAASLPPHSQRHWRKPRSWQYAATASGVRKSNCTTSTP